MKEGGGDVGSVAKEGVYGGKPGCGQRETKNEVTKEIGAPGEKSKEIINIYRGHENKKKEGGGLEEI